jgi:uncharacterized membrane protein
MRKWIPALLIIAATAASAVVYPRLPAQMPTHWTMSGEVNGWSSRLFGAWMVPLMMAVMWLILRAVPHIDPRRENYEKFKGVYETLIVLILLFMLGIHLLLLAKATGSKTDVGRVALSSTGLLFIALGFLLPKAHPNWFVGIRTPWTLTSDVSWERTHRIGGPLFMLIGALTAVTGLVAPTMTVWVLVASVVAVTVFLFVYSYRVWKEDTHRHSSV